MRRRCLALAAVVVSLTPAAATGTLVCEIDDRSVELSVTATLGGLRRGTVVNFGGNLDLKKPGKLPADLHKIELGKDDFSQAWIHGRVIKLQLYRERTEKPGAYVLVTIETNRVSEGEYRGRYLIETDVADADNAYGSKPRKVRGRATCSTD
jgi:hypothetical protein